MKSLLLNPSTFGFIVGTRALLAAGAGLVIAGRLSAERRRAVGTALLAVGAATTVPALLALRRAARRESGPYYSLDYHPGLRGVGRFPRKGDDVADDIVLRDERAYRTYEREEA